MTRRTPMRDDDLRERLAELAAEADVALPASRDVRARGDRRRVRVTAAAAGLSVLAVVAGVVGVSSAKAPPASFTAGDGTPTPSQAFPSVVPATSSPPSPTPTFRPLGLTTIP